MTSRPVQRLVLGLGALLVGVLMLAGCGGGGGDAIATSAGQKLLEQSDLVAAKLAQGDDCAARKAASALQRSSEAAIANSQIPAPLVRELRQRTARLASSITCVPPPPPARPQVSNPSANPGRGYGHGRGGGKGHGKGHGKGRGSEEGDG